MNSGKSRSGITVYRAAKQSRVRKLRKDAHLDFEGIPVGNPSGDLRS
jgi:hypothetical protein